MRNKKNLLLISSILLSTICSSIIAKDIGSILVDSSTIDDKYDSKNLEVSNTIIVKSENIEKKHSENIANVLNSLPGLTVRANEGDSNKIHIRGIASEVYMGEKPGVAIVIDGVPVQERAGSVNIDSDNIESIKIIKGGASYLYGNDALAGAVIITTKKPKNKNEAKISYERASFNYEKSLARANVSNDNLAFEIQGSNKSSDGYWENSDYWTRSVNSKLQYYINDSSDITFGVDKSKRFENDTGSITHIINGVDQIATNPKSKGEVGYATNYNIDLDKYFVTYSKDFSNDSNLMTQVYLYEDTTKNKSGAFDNDLSNNIIRDDHKYKNTSNTKQKGLKSEYRINGNILASLFGIDLARNKENKSSIFRVDFTNRGVTTPKGTVSSDTKSNEKINALYTELKYQINDNLLTSFNARYDQIKYDYENHLNNKIWKKDFNETSYKLGSSYKVSKNSVFYSNFSTGFRVPSISQLYAGDMNSTYNGTYSNNPNIKTEKTYNIEAGFRSKNELFSYDFSFYNLDRKDVIGKSTGNYASTKGVDLQYDNMADIQNRGFEFTLNTNKKENIYYSFNYTFLDSKYKTYDNYHLILRNTGTGKDEVASIHNLANNVVPRTSKHTANFEINYKLIPKLLLSSDIRYRSSQYADELNYFKVKAYTLVDLRTSYKTKVSTYELEIFTKIKNVFDKQYYMMPRITGDRNENGVYDIGDMGLTVNPGRVYLAGLSLKF